MAESLGVQPNTPNLPGLLQIDGEVLLGVLGQPLDCGGGPQRPSLQQLERRRDDGIHRPGNRECDQPASLDRLTGHRRADSARVRKIQQHRAGQHPLAAGTVETGLSGRVVQQQQKQVLGDLRHRRTVNRTAAGPRIQIPRRGRDLGVVGLGADQRDLDGVAVWHV